MAARFSCFTSSRFRAAWMTGRLRSSAAWERMNVLNDALFGLYGRSWIDGRSELTRTVAKAVYFGDMKYQAAMPATPARMMPSVAAAIPRRRSERSSDPKSGPDARPGGAVSGGGTGGGAMRPTTGRRAGL